MKNQLQLKVAGRLERQIQRILLKHRLQPSPETVLSLAGLAQLVVNGYLPKASGSDALDKLLRRLAGNSSRYNVTIDGCQFAKILLPILESAAQFVELPALEVELEGLIGSEFDEFWLNPNALGWLYQCINKANGISQRQEIPLERIASATQWFTPDWVADFLVEEVLDRPQSNFLDPACGAGHLLVAALKRCCVGAGSESAPAAVGRALERVYGFDIDPLMVRLANFAIYLYCRRQAGSAELPLPQVYLVESQAAGQSVGSLALALPGSLITLRDCFDKSSAIAYSTFDAIAANPPYLSHRRMPEQLGNFLKRYYSSAQYDLYAAFLVLGERILRSGGRMAMICQQSFLSIQRYERLRQELLSSCSFRVVVQLGSGSFAARNGEKANNAIVVLHKDGVRNSTSARVWRLLSPEDKKLAETVGLHALPSAVSDMSYCAGVGNALSPWCPNELKKLFQSCPPLESEGTGMVCVNGLFTCDNSRFVKLWNQIDATHAASFVPYDKGGGHKWFRTTPYVLQWEEDGAEIRRFRRSRGQAGALPGYDFYFKPGVTYSYIGTKGFRARLLSPGSIFDIASSSVFSKIYSELYLLGFLNSALTCFLLGVLNPTINFQIGDIRRIPFVAPDDSTAARVSHLAAEAVSMAKQVEVFEPQSPRYAGADSWFQFCRESHACNEKCLAKIISESQKHACEVNQREESLQAEIDDLIFELYRVDEKLRQRVLEDPWVRRSRTPLMVTPRNKEILAELSKGLTAI